LVPPKDSVVKSVKNAKIKLFMFPILPNVLAKLSKIDLAG